MSSNPAPNLGQPSHCFPAAWLNCVHIYVCACLALQATTTKKSKIYFYIFLLREKFIKYTCCAILVDVFKIIGVLTLESDIHRIAKVAILGHIDWNNQCLCLCWLLALKLLKAKQTSGIRSQLSLTGLLNHWDTVQATPTPVSLWFAMFSWTCPLFFWQTIFLTITIFFGKSMWACWFRLWVHLMHLNLLG